MAFTATAPAVYLGEDREPTWQQLSGGPLGWDAPGIHAGFPIDHRRGRRQYLECPRIDFQIFARRIKFD